MVDSDSAEAKSPERFLKMGRLLKESGRQIDYFLCQWGIGENVPEWQVFPEAEIGTAPR